MSDEIQYRSSTTGDTLYFTVRNAAGLYWNGGTVETMDVPSWGEYDVALTETPASSYYFLGNFPSTIATGTFNIEIYRQLPGGSPGISDKLIGAGEIQWFGPAGGVTT